MRLNRRNCCAIAAVAWFATVLVGCSTDSSQSVPPLLVTPSTIVASSAGVPADFAAEEHTKVTANDLAPTVTPKVIRVLPEISPQALLDREPAVQLACELLKEEYGYCYGQSTALYTPVTFPSGQTGAFIAVGDGQILLRTRDDQVELVDRRFSPDNWGEWGWKELVDGRPSIIPGTIEWLDLFVDQAEVIKVTGWAHPGTDQRASGVFEIIRVTDDGLHTLFRDYEQYNFTSYYAPPGQDHSPGLLEQYEYKYTDQDGDGIKEIIKQGTKCETIYDETTDDVLVVPEHCDKIRDEFKYDGTQYVLKCCAVYQQLLPGGYVVLAAHKLQDAVILEPQSDGGYFPAVWPSVLSYGWNDDFILAKTQPALDNLNWRFDSDRFLWYLIELNSGKTTMVYSEEEFAALRSQLGVPDNLVLDHFIQDPIVPETATPTSTKDVGGASEGS